MNALLPHLEGRFGGHCWPVAQAVEQSSWVKMISSTDRNVGGSIPGFP